VSPTSPVCPASVSSTIACRDTLCRLRVPAVSPRKPISPDPTFPGPRTTRSTCRRCVTDSSTSLSRGIDRQLLVLTRCVSGTGKNSFKLDHHDSHCLHDVLQLVTSPHSLCLSFLIFFWTLVTTHGWTYMYLGNAPLCTRISRACVVCNSNIDPYCTVLYRRA
jgi:hypothetical protein